MQNRNGMDELTLEHQQETRQGTFEVCVLRRLQVGTPEKKAT
jgi:hypothetical protein